MNSIDVKFNNIMQFLRTKNENQLFEHILNNYKWLPVEMQRIYQNYFVKFNYWGTIDLENNNYEYFELKAKDIINNLQDIEWLYNKLQDYSSKRLLVAILDNWINYNVDLLKSTIDVANKHYFDLDLIPNCENEVFVDLGAYTGDTLLDFIDTYGKDCYKKIYCYEITPNIFNYLTYNTKQYDNIDCRLKAVKDKKGKITIETNKNDISSNRTKDCTSNDNFVECVSIDDDIKEPITMIKMDIEGDEPYAIKGAKKHIKNDSPKLLISVYHNNNHLWQLPKLIDSINSNYHFYLRNYCGKVYPTEIVLIAVPIK